MPEPAPTLNSQALAAKDGGNPSVSLLNEMLDRMLLIRRFEETADELSLKGRIPGGIHSAVGQEAVAVGIGLALRETDLVAGTHRNHHHALAKGLEPAAVMAELYGRATGCNGGRGGSMHLSDLSHGYLGGNGIVGAGVGLAMGAALAAQVRESDQVCLGIFGEGGANVGRVWESINLAAVWKLPLIIVCENNVYAVETAGSRVTAGSTIAARAAGFGLPAEQVDGQNVLAVYAAVSAAADRARAGEGPTFLEALTYRYQGHSTGEVVTYRTAEEVESWRQRDPIAQLRQHLELTGQLAPSHIDAAKSRVDEVVADAVRRAEEAPWPEPSTLLNGVVSPSLGQVVLR